MVMIPPLKDIPVSITWTGTQWRGGPGAFDQYFNRGRLDAFARFVNLVYTGSHIEWPAGPPHIGGPTPNELATGSLFQGVSDVGVGATIAGTLIYDPAGTDGLGLNLP